MTGDLVNVAMWFWDTNALAWVKASGGSATGPNVNVSNFPAVYPSTVADGANVAQGTTTDVSGTPTTIGLLKQIASAGPGGSGAGSVNVLNQVHVIIDNQPISVTGAAGGSSGGSVVVLNQITALITGTPTVLQGGAPWQVAGSIAATQGGVWNVGISGTPTVLQGNAPWQVAGSVAATQGGVWNVGITGTPTVLQGTPPWQVAGSVAVTGLGSVNIINSITASISGPVTIAPFATPSSTFVAGSFGSVNVLNTVNVLVTGQPLSVISATPSSTFVAGAFGSVNVLNTVTTIISGTPTVDVRSSGLSSVSVVGTVNTIIGAGTSMMGSVNVASGVIQVLGGTVVTGQPATGLPLASGGQASTTNPVPVADGTVVEAQFDQLGKFVTYPFAVRQLMQQGGSTTSGTGETTFIAAGSNTQFHDLAVLILSNLGSMTAPTVFIRDRTGGPIIFSFKLGAFQSEQIPFSRPWEQKLAGNPWTMQLDTAGGSVFVAGQVVKLI